MSDRDLSQLSMLELYRLDAVSQIQSLTTGLLALERDPAAADQLEACMRAAHSLKGAAQVVGLDAGVGVSHAMEDCFVAAQRGEITLKQAQIDVLLRGVDLLNRIAETAEANIAQWASGKYLAEIASFHGALTAVLELRTGAMDSPENPQRGTESTGSVRAESPAAQFVERRSTAASEVRENAERVLRVTAENVNRLLGLAGESLVESRRLKPFAESLLWLKRLQEGAIRALENDSLSGQQVSELGETAFADARRIVHECHEQLSQRLGEMEMFEARSTNLAHRLYEAVLAARMRPFADGVRAFPRMVRDTGRSLGKDVRLEIVGQSVQVDRDILEKLEAPLGHLLATPSITASTPWRSGVWPVR